MRQHYDQIVADPEGMLDFTAQTTVASSYGLMQVMWRLAVLERGFRGPNGELNPHLLLDPDLSMKLGTTHLLSKFRLAFRLRTPANLPAMDAEDFKRKTELGLSCYNGCQGLQPTRYGKSVLERSANYRPVVEKPIFD